MKSVIKNINKIANLYPNRSAYISVNEKITYMELNEKILKMVSFFSEMKQDISELSTICEKETNALASLLATSLLDIDNSIIPYKAHRYTKDEDVEFTNDVIVITEEDVNRNGIILTDKSFNFVKSSNAQISVKDIMEKKDIKDIQLFLENKNDSSSRLVLYTSGTTGKSKGVIVSYNQFNFINSPINIDNEAVNIITRGSSVRPFLGTMLSTLKEGKTILQVDVDNHSDVAAMYDIGNIESITTNIYGIKKFITIASAVEGLFNEVPLVTITGGVMHQYLREKSSEAFPNAKLLDLYGQTELGLISVIDSTEWLENEYCVGTPSFFVEVIIKDIHSGEQLQENEIGHITVKSNHRFRGYTNYTAEVLDEVYTGDLGYLKDGKLYLLGRISDCIKYDNSWYLRRDIECSLSKIVLEKFQVLVKDEVFYIILEKYSSEIEKIIEHKFSSFRQLIQIKVVEEINETN
ncbi:AMP-binding protein [Enterococcus rotai]|uniref:AMP-binding protein n=1 Tax=Enterococcus rotai TaxID=118060 RepID=UPI0032B3F272